MKKKPSVFAHIAACLFAFLLVVLTALGGLLWQMNRLLTDAQLHEQIALDARVTDAQLARIESAVAETAARYSFTPESVMDVITRDAVCDYNREIIAWWMGLLNPDPAIEAPEWDTSAMEEAVREDVLFQENTPANQRKALARNTVAYEVGQAVERTVLPLRVKLAVPFLPKVLAKVDVPHLMAYLGYAPAALAVLSAVLCLLILCSMHRRTSLSMLYIGSGLVGGALSLLLAGLTVYGFHITGQVAELSPIMGMQVSLLTRQVALQAGLFALICLTAGIVLISLYQGCARRTLRRGGSLAA